VRRPQFCDEPKYAGKQMSRNGDLGHLEGDVVALAEDDASEIVAVVIERRLRVEAGSSSLNDAERSPLRFIACGPLPNHRAVNSISR
jgi:hypothetical protein